MAKATKIRSETAEVAEVARGYFEAIAARDLDAALAMWAPGGIDRVVGQAELLAPDGIRAYFEELFGAFPDFKAELLDVFAEGERATLRWRTAGTFAGPGAFQGLEPTGARVDVEGCDVTYVRDGLIQSNHVYFDATDLARQVGALPPKHSPAERGMTAALNARTRLGRRLAAGPAERVADGVWLIRGGFPQRIMNVYLIEDDAGVTLFDAGIESMTKALTAAAVGMGGIKRIVLGHGHPDHRGAAPGLGAPVLCHPAEVADAEGDGGEHYFDIGKLEFAPARFLMPRLLRRWDGGPVNVEDTLEEGDEVAGFRVLHLPGHAPGLIGLWRESDRLALVSDCFYTLDPQTGRKGHPRVPHRAFNLDTDQARESVRKLAAMEPAAAWPGHADPLVGDVRAQLERAADTT